jgi:hypothetical protein
MNLKFKCHVSSKISRRETASNFSAKKRITNKEEFPDLPEMPVVLQEVAEETPVGKPGLLMYVLLNTTTLPDVHWFTEAEIKTQIYRSQLLGSVNAQWNLSRRRIHERTISLRFLGHNPESSQT